MNCWILLLLLLGGNRGGSCGCGCNHGCADTCCEHKKDCDCGHVHSCDCGHKNECVHDCGCEHEHSCECDECTTVKPCCEPCEKVREPKETCCDGHMMPPPRVDFNRDFSDDCGCQN